MKKLKYDDQDMMKDWASVVMNNQSPWPADTVAIGVEVDGELVAVICWNYFEGASCQAHIASNGKKNWASPEILAGLFAYPFIQCKLRRVTAPIPAKNLNAQMVDLKLGFRLEGTLRHAYEDDDQIIMGMLRSECRWLDYLDKREDNG